MARRAGWTERINDDAKSKVVLVVVAMVEEAVAAGRNARGARLASVRVQSETLGQVATRWPGEE